MHSIMVWIAGGHLRPYPQVVPLEYAIDRDGSIGCGVCEKVCVAKAIKYVAEVEERGTGGGLGGFGPGVGPSIQVVSPVMVTRKFPNVVRSKEFERILAPRDHFRATSCDHPTGRSPRKIAWLQCVGSRDEEADPYCSSVCCMYAIKEAVIAKEHCKESPGRHDLFHGYADLWEGVREV